MVKKKAGCVHCVCVCVSHPQAVKKSLLVVSIVCVFLSTGGKKKLVVSIVCVFLSTGGKKKLVVSIVCVFLSTGGEEEYNGQSDGAVQKGWPVISGNRELCCPYHVHGFWLCQITKAVLTTVFMSRSLAEIICLVVGSWWCFHYYTVLFGRGFQVLFLLLFTYCDHLVPGGTQSHG